MKTKQLLMNGIVVGGILWSVNGTWADEAGDQRLEALDQKVKILERKLEITEASGQAKPKETPAVTAGEDGFSLSSADKAFQLKLRGYIQADGRFYLNDGDNKSADTFLLRRVRPVFEGTLYENVGFKIMPDFGSGQTVLQDAYGELKLSPLAEVRVGKFKPPVGLERLQSARDIEFVERGLPTDLVPNRDVGLQLSGAIEKNVLRYEVGLFNGVTDGGSSDQDSTDAKDLAARLFAQPFWQSGIESLSGLGVGFAGTVGRPEGTQTATGMASYKTIGQQTFFSFKTGTNLQSTVVAEGYQVRLVPQAYYYYGSFGLLSEFAQSSVDVRQGDKQERIDNQSWQVAVSYVVTGEKASYKGVTPLYNFAPALHHWGALEVVARYGELNVDDKAFSGGFADAKKSAASANAWGVGVNWYLKKNVKLVADYDRTTFDGGAALGDRSTEQFVSTRAQVAF